MDNPIVSWLFETDAVRVCPEGQPFWYTSGKLGPFYINTQFLYGSEAAANALLSVIEEACAGDKLAFYGKVYGEIEKQLAACPIYHQLIDLMCEAARSMDVDFVSGGERRDFFFSMPVARRLELLRWAAGKPGRYIIEDDYDSEFRYASRPIPALRELDREGRVIYVNTFSKSLAPGLRIGYLVLPDALMARYRERFSLYAATVSSFDQFTLAAFMHSGGFERHISRSRKVYQARRDALMAAIDR